MLVLSRKVGEKLVIGDNITVEIVRISGNRVSIGLVAPDNVKILRGELRDRQPEKAIEHTASVPVELKPAC